MEILNRLHSRIYPKSDRQISIVASLPSNLVYTQSFVVPAVGKDELDEAAILNLQMISPIGPDRAYMSWQLLKEEADRLEFLGAVVERAVIDQYKNLISSAKFQAEIFEFPGLALGRIVGRVSNVKGKPVLLIWVSGDGLNIFSFVDGILYFDYFRSWRSIRGDERRISKSVFEAAVIEEMRKFMNFATNRFKEEFKEIYIIAPGLESEMKNLIQGNFDLTVTPFVLSSYKLPPAWYGVLGSAIRSTWDRNEDHFINLNEESSFKANYEGRVLNFVHLWRNIFATAFGFLFLVFGLSAFYLTELSKSVSSSLSSVANNSDQGQITFLLEEAEQFNNLVTAVKGVRQQNGVYYKFVEDIRDIAGSNQIILDTVSISSLQEQINITAHAPDSDTVIKFKNNMMADKRFFDVNLPLGGIEVLDDGSVRFNLSFYIKSESVPQNSP